MSIQGGPSGELGGFAKSDLTRSHDERRPSARTRSTVAAIPSRSLVASPPPQDSKSHHSQPYHAHEDRGRVIGPSTS